MQRDMGLHLSMDTRSFENSLEGFDTTFRDEGNLLIFYFINVQIYYEYYKTKA